MKGFATTICIVFGLVLSNNQIAHSQDKSVLGGEFGLPLYQNYNGIFMDTDYVFSGCVKYTVF